MRPWLALVAVFLFCLPPAIAQGENKPPAVWEIKAVLEPPFTYFSIEAIDPETDDLSFSWTLTHAGKCTFFTSDGPSAAWRHDDERDCPHDAAAHPGLIEVAVSDGDWIVSRMYDGGSAGFDPGPADWALLARVSGGPFIGGNEEGDDPRDVPLPAIFGEELDCGASAVRGAFAPLQAVWQDEELDIFADAPTKRLSVESPRVLHAELQLVVGKFTQLFGVRGSRDAISFEGSLSGSTLVPAVVRWTLEDASGSWVLGELDAGRLPLIGDCGSVTPFSIPIDTTKGLAIRHFVIHAAGDYTITMELAAKGGARVPGSQVILRGDAEKVHEPMTYFVGAVLQGNLSRPERIAAAARGIAEDSALHIPDYFPLPPAGFHVIVRPTFVDLRGSAASAANLCDHQLGNMTYNGCFLDAMRVAVENRFAGGAWQLRTTTGEIKQIDRVVVVVSLADMLWLYPSPSASVAGFAANTKTMFVDDTSPYHTVAHEFAHTTPEAFWLNEVPACGVEYHNLGHKLGNGFQLTLGGVAVREPHDREPSLMSSGPGASWIEQCTYWHLVNHLNQARDPELLGLRGWITQNGTQQAAGLFDGMTFDGPVGREPGGVGPFAVRLLGSGGALLAEHRFDAPFVDDTGVPRRLVSFSMAVERPPGLERIELVGASGTLAQRNVSANAPVLEITSADRTSVAWRASDSDGDALSFGIVASPDGGKTWMDVDIDVTTSSATIDPAYFANATAPRVRVTATDGVNSAMVEKALEAAPPPTAPTTESATHSKSDTPNLGILGVTAAILAAVAWRRRP